MDKLLEKSDINTMKTLTNTWGVIKKKLRVVWEADANPEATVASEGKSSTVFVSVLPKEIADSCSSRR